MRTDGTVDEASAEAAPDQSATSLTIAVNEDAPIDSLDELAENADLFGDRIVGIEPGSGLMRITGDDVVPGYGWGDMELVESSTPAMLAELKKATDAGENIVVTLWRPHWAYNAFPVKDLEDPQGLLGDAEEIHTVAASSFGEDFPEVHGWLSDFQMPSDLLYSLEDAMFNQVARSVAPRGRKRHFATRECEGGGEGRVGLRLRRSCRGFRHPARGRARRSAGRPCSRGS